MADAILCLIPDIPGESLLAGFEQHIHLLSYSHGVSMQVATNASNTKRTTGKAMVQEFTVSKVMDASTPMLNQKCVLGDTIGEVVITVARNDPGGLIPVIVYTLQETFISSVSIGGGGGGEPIETLTLNFTRIQWDYQVQKKTGGAAGMMPAVYDLTTNSAE